MSGNDQPDLGRYEVVALLAVGGMGELFLARERGIGGFERLVAIKRILPRFSRDVEIRDMFLREARILARLNHPNVVQTIELGEDADANYYLVLEYIHGSTLRELQVLAQEADREFPVEVAIGAVVQGLRGLHAAHELSDMHGNPLGLIHRDISPHNLMCTPDGHVKLFDFGIAKATVKDELTYSGNLKGKFPYMSPEQCERAELDRRSDIFSMGIVLWELCAGRRLFRRDSELATMTAITGGDVPSLHDERSGVPPRLVEIIERALQVDPSARWQSAEAFSQALIDLAAYRELDITPGRIARFVNDVAGERLKARMESLAAAAQRSLTEGERRDVAHVEGSDVAATVPDHTDRVDTIQLSPPARDRRTLEERPSAPVPAPTDASEQAAPQVHGLSFGRQLAIGAVLVGIVAAIVYGVAMLPGPSGEPLELAWAPTIEPAVLREEMEPLRLYLQEELDRPVHLTVPESYEATAEQLVFGRVDIAALPPALYVNTRRKSPEITPLATKVADGSPGTDGLILVPFESDARTIEDLRGATFCFSDEDSTTGYLLPMAYLRSLGHDPDEFIGEIHWSGDHISVMRDLLDGRCQAGGTNSGNLVAASSSGMPAAKFRRLAITGSIPHGIVTAAEHLDQKTRDAVARALLAFDPREEVGTEALGGTQQITGFAPPDHAAYDALEKALHDEP